MGKISGISGAELLKLAEERVFYLGLRDLASALSYENMKRALGKMIYALDDEDVWCVLSPDATITRNGGRWLSGFGYGGVIRWQDDEMIFPEIRPNACGMLFMRLDKIPPRKKLVRRVPEIEDEGLTLDGVEITPDFGKGNHFFEFYSPLEISEREENNLPPDSHFAILHSSAPEMKEKVYSYVDRGKKVETPLGTISKLEGEAAKEYYETWKKLESFAKRRREILAEKVIEDFELISNFTHQGLFSRNEARLGCYDCMIHDGNGLFPVTLRWDRPTFVFRGRRNLSEDIITRHEFKERSDKLALKDELRNINILPHGGGYEIKMPYTKIEITNSSVGNVFTLSGPEPANKVGEISKDKMLSEFGKITITNPKDLPYTYRGEEVIQKIIELGLADPVAKLRPVLTLKV